MSKIRAKFVCTSLTPVEGEQTELKLMAVTTGSEENKSFSRWTPSGDIRMLVSNETTAATAFELGKEYYVDFSPAE